MPRLEERLNDTVRLLLTRVGQPHARLAEVCEITRVSMSARLRGKHRWPLDDIEKVADHFGLTVCELISGYQAIPEERLPPPAGSAGQTRI